jgi:UDP-N-acetylmuramate dehydrogenase
VTGLRWEEEAPLTGASTLRLESTARLLARATDAAGVREALDRSAALGLPLWVLGGGSNVLLAERLEGVVLQLEDRRLEVREDGDRVRLRVGAGHDWHALVRRTVEAGWWGLENLALVPGSVGAAPVQNIGAYGRELSEVCTGVRALRRADGAALELTAEECAFAYRDSRFRRAPGDWILLEVSFSLSRRGVARLDYPGVRESLGARSADDPRAVADAVAELRRRRLPDPLREPNAGSFFKNPVLSRSAWEALAERYPELPGHESEEGVKVPAAWLIERCGWRGRRRGPLRVSERHALVLVHEGGVGATELLAFAAEIRTSVEERFGVRLEREPVLLGREEPDPAGDGEGRRAPGPSARSP